MEATERSVSNEAALFPGGVTDDEKRVLEVLRKAKVLGDRHMTKVRIAQALGAHGHAIAGVWKTVVDLAKRKLIVERVDEAMKESDYVVADVMPNTVRIHRRTYKAIAAAALRAKVKQLYDDGLKYDEIRQQLDIPRGTVSTVVRRLIANGEIKPRGQGRRGVVSEPKSTEVEIPIIITDENEEEHEDDEPKVLEQAGPDVAEILKAFENGANEIRRMGWHVELQVKLSYPAIMHRGAS